MRKGKYFYLYTHYYWIQWTDQITKTIDETTTTMRNTCTYLPWNQAFIFCLATPKHPKNVKKKPSKKKIKAEYENQSSILCYSLSE